MNCPIMDKKEILTVVYTLVAFIKKMYLDELNICLSTSV